MDFDLPEHLVTDLAELDEFIEREIKPLERADDNIRFFDHRRYRITQGSEEIQMRRLAGYLFGFMSQRAPKGVSPRTDAAT